MPTPELQFSQIGPDIKAIIGGLKDAVRDAWPDISGTGIFVDRMLIASTLPNYAVIVYHGCQMTGAEGGDVSLRQILQVHTFTIIRVGKISAGMNVIGEKIDKYDAIAAELMSDIHFLGEYELPSITNVDFSEAEPNPDKYVLPIDFTVRCANWRYAEV